MSYRYEYPLDAVLEDDMVHLARHRAGPLRGDRVETACGKTGRDTKRDPDIWCPNCQERLRGASPAASEPAEPLQSPADSENRPETPPVPLEVRLVELSAVSLKPSDILVLHTAGDLDDQECRDLYDEVARAFPGHSLLLVTRGDRLSMMRPARARRHPRCSECGHTMGSHYPTTGCIRCTCRIGQTPSPV